MHKILTIVVPSYNTEKYMDECLPTILNAQSIDDLEVLLINDGSKDHTAEKALKYQEESPNSVRLISKENGGHGSVINRGIEEASGKYFKVIDGDDWVKTDGLDRLVSELKECDADLITNPKYVHDLRSGKETLSDVTSDTSLFGKKLKFEDVCNKLNGLFIHNITYKTAILRDNGVKVQEHCFYEDKEYDIYPLPYIQTIKFLDFPVYVYRVGSGSQSISKESLMKNKDMHYRILSNLIAYYSNLGIVGDKTRSFIKKSVDQMMISNYGLFYRQDYSNAARCMLKDFDKTLKKDFPEYYQNTSGKLVKLLRNTSWPVYTAVYLMYKRKREKRGF